MEVSERHKHGDHNDSKVTLQDCLVSMQNAIKRYRFHYIYIYIFIYIYIYIYIYIRNYQTNRLVGNQSICPIHRFDCRFVRFNVGVYLV